ncbi:MAG: type III secretion system chaperone [Pseudomonadota bacterium]
MRWLQIPMAVLLLGLVPTGCDDAGPGSLIRTAVAEPMTAERLGELIVAVDDNASQDGNSWFFRIEGLETTVVFDVAADRMRIVIPIVSAEELEPAMLTRLLQANFDTALDARYAIANGQVWGTFIHPLSSLSDEQFLVGLAQTANVVLTFGTSFNSGVFIFGGGDSADIERRQLIDELKRKQRI